ncbi:hypothetical protein [Natrinema salaciae]|uniref:Uncharacterized protein n=1 Tax=Natrinema salaciae TaxID=1186196 RepID=A0A1H9AR45_9EURY|nr:hypothetical protein [Natrinema salaciae]SEP79264.1 hypothetical protein SAMN04489841_0524 [Natrinema salaciae]
MGNTKELIRRPAYTGDDRCWPCTIANGILLTVGVGILTVTGRRTVAAAVAVVGAVAIWLRGYLVPYTPRFAPRLVAALPVDVGVHDDARERDAGSLSDADIADEEADAAPPSGETVVTALLEAGVVVPAGEELRLEESFRTEWRREMDHLRGRELEELAAEADALTDSSIDARVGRDWRGRPSTVRLVGDGSRGVSLDAVVAVAELAAARALEPRIDDERVRLAAGRPLRSLLERCPRCDRELTVSQSTCCGEVTPIGSTPAEKLRCPDCDVRLFTYD